MGIKKTKKGQWKVDQRDRFGRRFRRTFLTKSEAREFLRKIHSGDIRTKSDEVTLKHAIRHYYDNVSAKKVKETHANEKKYFEDLYLFAGQNGINYLAEFEPADIEAFQTELARKNSASTVNRKFNTYKHFFRKCIGWGWLISDPCRTLNRLIETPKERKVWPDDKVALAIDSIPYWAKGIVFFIAMTGVRPGQARKLTWEAVDLERNVVTVYSIKGGGRCKARKIHVTDEMNRFLKIIKGKRSKDGSDDFVFLNSGGNFITKDVLSSVGQRVRESVGLEGFVIYDLRHTYITLMAEQNLNADTMRRLIGHADIRMTQHYINQSDKHLKEQAEKIEKLRRIETPALGNIGHSKIG